MTTEILGPEDLAGIAARADAQACYEVRIHGHRVCFRIAGSGPLVVLAHGITGSSAQWIPVIEALQDRFTLFAPDLLIGLDAERATIVGHSLGGGIAMQLAYQYPERCGRLVLMSSGGIARDVHLLLRAASLPGAEIVLPLITHARLLRIGEAVGRALSAIGLRAGADLVEGGRGYASLNDRETRAAFLHTIRAVIDPTGQRISALDRLYLAEAMPSLILWGAEDPIIPAHHGQIAHDAMPGSQFELIPDAGHFPQLTHPTRVARILADFIDGTEAAELEAEDMRELVLARMSTAPA